METERFSFVELDTGEQEFFANPYTAFKYAKKQESKRRGSVEYVAVGQFYENDEDETEALVYQGQYLRWMLRSLDDTIGWLKAVAYDRQDNDEDS